MKQIAVGTSFDYGYASPRWDGSGCYGVHGAGDGAGSDLRHLRKSRDVIDWTESVSNYSVATFEWVTTSFHIEKGQNKVKDE